MQSNYAGRIYSPQLTEQTNIAFKRLAWALNLPMTKIPELMVKFMSVMVQSSKVCLSCRDKSQCQFCAFRNTLTPQEKDSFLAPLADIIV